MGKLTEEQKRNAREFFRQNELAPPYDRELEELATILAPTAHVAHTAALVERIAQRDKQIDAYNVNGFADADAMAEKYLILDGEVKALRKVLGDASHALRSYQYGNSSEELAKEMADSCDAALDGQP